MRSDVSVQIAAVLEDLVAEGAAVNPLVLSGFVSLQDSPAVWSPLCCCCCCCLWAHWRRGLHCELDICTHQEPSVKER